MLEGNRRISLVGRTGVLLPILRNSDGSMLPIFATGVLILAALTGGGVDMARGYKAERRMQAACDAGVLAARRVVNTPGYGEGLSDEVEDKANEYVQANFDDDEHSVTSTQFAMTSPDDGSTINGVMTGDLHTMIVAAFGFEEIELSVSCSASMGVGNSDIMFVLDNTGSMDWKPDGSSTSTQSLKRIYALQEAMRDFYDTVAETMAGGNTRVRYGFVPYSSSVRVGQLIHDIDATYLADSITVPSVAFVNWNATPIASGSDTNFTYTSANYTNWTHHTSTQYTSSSSCNNNKPADTVWVNNGSPTAVVEEISVNSTNGRQLKTMDMKQPQTMTDYECRQSSNRWYIDRRTGSRERTNGAWEERAPIPVTTSNSTFLNAVLQQRTFSTSSFKNFNSVTLPIGINRSVTPNRISNVSSTWQGCITERQTTTDASFSFVSLLTGITPSGATDLDIDTAPTSDPSTKWSPLWPELGYVRDASNVAFDNLDENDFDEGGYQTLSSTEISDNKASSACPYEAQLFEEMDEADFNDYVDHLTPTGGTYHDIGLLWGARLSSPSGMWSDTVNEEPTNGGSVSRHLIFMTDGELDPDREAYTAYGIEMNDHRVTPDGSSDSAQLSRHRSRYLAICEAIKARGIRLWVIAFGSTVSLSADLQACASPDSAFRAVDSAQLNQYFQEIANQVGELRVTQ
jgi:hypothetical protein